MSETFCVPLPDIGEGVVEGEVIEWLKEEGEFAEQDEPVVVVMTDKATVELPAPHPGVISKHYYQPGEIAIRDEPLYDIELAVAITVGGDKPPSPSVKKEKKSPSLKSCPKAAKPDPVERKGKKALATPAVRKLAKELGVSLEDVPGTGPMGRVLREDVQRFFSGRPLSPSRSRGRAGPQVAPGESTPIHRLPGDEVQPLMGFRNFIAEKMVESKYLVPHFAYFSRLDATRLVQMRQKSKAEAASHGVKLTFMPYFIRALSLALKEYPQFNSSVDLEEKTHVIHHEQNIGIAMKAKEGLIVPVLKGVQNLSFHELIQRYDALRQKALEDALEASDMKESTITVSNFGTEGGLYATPIINYPEVCILGLGRMEKEPVVRGDQVVIRPMLNLSWCGDHRVLDGDKMAAFSNLFIKLLENPAHLL